MTTKQNTIESLLVSAMITATSVKQKGDFESKTKTAYIKADDKNTKLLKAFGLEEYGKEEKFFIVKFSQKAKAYNGPNDKAGHALPVGLDTPNFHIDKEPVLINLTHSTHMKNDVRRISAVMYHKPGLFEEVEADSPFLNVFGEDYNDPFKDFPTEDEIEIKDEDLPF